MNGILIYTESHSWKVSVIWRERLEGMNGLNYVEVYKTVLNFHRKYSKVKGTDEFWDSVKVESEQIFEKYDKSRFVKEMLLAVINELERKWKETKVNEQSRVPSSGAYRHIIGR